MEILAHRVHHLVEDDGENIVPDRPFRIKYTNFELFSNTACPRNSVTPLRFCFDHNFEMEGRRELIDVLS
jgi:hypothetical protein